MIFFLLMVLAFWQQLPLGGVPISAGGTNFTVTQHTHIDSLAGLSTLAATVTSTTLGNSIIVCTGNTSLGITALTVTDNASGGTNTYTARPTSNATHLTSDFSTYCFDSLNTPRGSATTVTVTFSSTPGYAKVDIWEIHKSTGTVSFDSSGTSFISNGTGTGTALTGPSVSTTGVPEFIAASVLVNDAVTAAPAAGNNFTAGGGIDVSVGGGAGASRILTTSGTSQPVFTDNSSSDTFCMSVVGYQ